MSPKPTSHKGSAKSKSKVNPESIKQESFLSLTALLILGILFYFYSDYLKFIQDDSYITYRYVKHFTEGFGLVFNIGEKVEGYTCFLWVILLSVVKVMGFNFISFSQTLGLIFCLLTIYFTYRISSSIFQKDKGTFYNITFGLIAVTLLTVNGSFAFWSASGMETGMFTFLVTLGIYLYLKETKNNNKTFPFSSFVFLLASLTRPEGNLIFAITVLHKIIFIVKTSSGDSKNKVSKFFSRNNLYWISVYVVPAIIYMIWRYSYYGYLLPNTFYAKTGTSLEYFKAGMDYFWYFAKDYALYGSLFVLILLNLKSQKYFYQYLYLTIILFIFILYVIAVGGDVLRSNRFFVPIMPVFYILIQEAIHNLGIQLEKKINLTRTYPSIAIIVLLIFSHTIYKNERDELKKYSELENAFVEKMKITGTWLKNKSTASGKKLTVAASTIGALSYFSETNLIDMLGLTDKEIAHNPKPIDEISENMSIGWKERQYNVEYVLSRKPDYIYFSTGVKPSAYAERGLFTAEEFMRNYYPYCFIVKEYNSLECIFKRKPEEEIKSDTSKPIPNPNYKKTFVNFYNMAMNLHSQAMNEKNRNKMEEALSIYKKSIESGPTYFSAPYQMIGDLYGMFGNKLKAFENYSKAVQLDDYNVMAHYQLYRLYLEKGDTSNAIISIEKIQRYSPDLLAK